jgi:hypothetical protein
MITLENYPILKSMVQEDVLLISEQDAFYLYQNNWHLVDPTRLSNEEILFINELIEKVGNGVFMVSFG